MLKDENIFQIIDIEHNLLKFSFDHYRFNSYFFKEDFFVDVFFLYNGQKIDTYKNVILIA